MIKHKYPSVDIGLTIFDGYSASLLGILFQNPRGDAL